MAWDTVLVENLRYWINDLESTAYAWTDAQLKKFICIAAINVIQLDLQGFESLISGPYSIDVSGPTISPDPTADASQGFSNLIVMKAACIIAGGELKKIGSTAGYKITDDRSTIDGTKAVEVAKQVASNYCDAYLQALLGFKQGAAHGSGEAILSPFATYEGQFSRGMWFDPRYQGYTRSG